MSSLGVDELTSLLRGACPDQEDFALGAAGEVLARAQPSSIASVSKLLSLLSEGMVPWTVGPLPPELTPERRVVVVDLSRLNRVDPVRPVDHLVRVEAGTRLETLARLLRTDGFSAAPLPGGALLGHALASRRCHVRYPSPGHAGTSLADRVVALSAVLPDGSRLDTRLAPRRATGPDLCALLLGSGGRTGVIVAATLRVDPLPERVWEQAWRLSSEEVATAALRRLAHRGLPITALATQGAMLALRVEGFPEQVRAVERAVGRLLSSLEPQGAPCPAGLLSPAQPALEAPNEELAGLTKRLRRALDPALLQRRWDELVTP